MAKKGLYVGTGIGLVLFALMGLLPGSMIGGVIGLKIAGGIFGSPLQATVLARLIIAACMITGVIAAAIISILGTGIMGWTIGAVIDSVRSKHEAVEAAHAAAR